MSCDYDKKGWTVCFNCPYETCIRNDIADDPFIEEPPTEKDNSDSFRENRFKESGKRQYIRYKGTYFDDERHKKAREYSRRKRYGIPQEPRVFKRKGREREYQQEYRANMDEEQKSRYRKWQREYQRAKRAREKHTA